MFRYPGAGQPSSINANIGGHDRAAGMAADVQAFGVAAVLLNVSMQPLKGKSRILALGRISKAVVRQSVADDGGDDSALSQRPGDEPVLCAVAFSEAAAVEKQKYRCRTRWSRREIQVQTLFDVFSVWQIEVMPQFSARGGRGRVGLPIKGRPVQPGFTRMQDRVVRRCVLGTHAGTADRGSG